MGYKIFIVLTLSLAAFATTLNFALAKHDTKDDNHHESNNVYTKNHNSGQFTTNNQYDLACGNCHWAYIPQLLPSGSWDNILKSLANHFGSEVSVPDQELSTIKDYLLTNSADKTDLKIGRKITKSLAGNLPIRISEIPYIRHKHNDISLNVFSRKSIQSLANCIACHPSATKADFDDDNVKIPSE